MPFLNTSTKYPAITPTPNTPAAHQHTARLKILFIGEAVSLAHVGRPALLARWAQEAGHDVHFACGPAFAHVAKNEGFKPFPLKTIPTGLFYNRLNQGRFFYTKQELENYITAERALLRRIKPDLVVGDFRLPLHISAKLEGIPMLSLNNAQWSPGDRCPLPPPRAGIFKHLSPGLCNALFKPIRPLAFRLFAKPIDDLRHQHGLTRLKDFRKCYTAGDACAYLDIPELMPLKKVPDGHFFLGPVAWKPANQAQPDLNAWPTGRPLAYVSMGSSGNEKILPRLLRALTELECNIVLSGIDPLRTETWSNAIPSLRKHLLAGRLLDPRSTLQQAQLTICHGGSGTVYQSLSHGVPLLCLPHNPDQILISKAVATTGAGSFLNSDNISSQKLKTVIASNFLNTTKHKNRAKQIAQVLATWDTRNRWLRWLKAAVPTTSNQSPGQTIDSGKNSHPSASALEFSLARN